MPKFYVQCGPVQRILQANSVEQAALAAIDHALQSHLWIYDDEQLTPGDCRDHLMLEALMHMEPVIKVSEQGFGRVDAVTVGTPETIIQWHKLIVGMQRLFVAAGLGGRSMSSVASGDQIPSTQNEALRRKAR